MGQGCSSALRCEVQLPSFLGEDSRSWSFLPQGLYLSRILVPTLTPLRSMGAAIPRDLGVKRDLGKKELEQRSAESEEPAWWAEGTWPREGAEQRHLGKSKVC